MNRDHFLRSDMKMPLGHRPFMAPMLTLTIPSPSCPQATDESRCLLVFMQGGGTPGSPHW